MRVPGALIAIVLAVAGCGGSPAARIASERSVATAACGVTSRLAPVPLAGQSGVYTAGPATLVVGEDLGQRRRASPGHPYEAEAIAVITSHRAVTLRAVPSPGVRLSLQFIAPSGSGGSGAWFRGGGAGVRFPRGGGAGVRFPACGQTTQRFRGGIAFAGSGCARVAVQPAGASPTTMLIPLAGSLRGCPSAPAGARLGYAWAPFLGVACGKANSIACDRIGVGVAASRRAALVVVRVAGHIVSLSPPSAGSNLWQGYVQDAGPRHGPLRVHPLGRTNVWSGSPEVFAHAWVTAYFSSGSVAGTGEMTVLLHPGFG